MGSLEVAVAYFMTQKVTVTFVVPRLWPQKVKVTFVVGLTCFMNQKVTG